MSLHGKQCPWLQPEGSVSRRGVLIRSINAHSQEPVSDVRHVGRDCSFPIDASQEMRDGKHSGGFLKSRNKARCTPSRGTVLKRTNLRSSQNRIPGNRT